MFDIETDFFGSSGIAIGMSAAGTGRFENFGALERGAGGGSAMVAVYFDNLGGKLDAETGTLAMDIGGSLGSSYQGGTFVANSAGVLDLTDGATVNISGTLVGSGNGEIELAGGTLQASAAGATLDFGNPLQWSAGTIDGSLGTVTIAAGSSLNITGQATENGALSNAGIVTLSGGALSINDGGVFTNQLGATFDITEDFGTGSGDVLVKSTTGRFENLGTVERGAGGGSAIVATYFDNLGGKLDAENGTLVMDIGGPLASSLRGGSYVANSGGVLDLTGGSTVEISGTLIGTGTGAIELAGGMLQATADDATLDFANPLQWSAGTIDGSQGAVTIAAGSFVAITGQVSESGAINNAGTVTSSGGALTIEDGGVFTNQFAAIFEHHRGFRNRLRRRSRQVQQRSLREFWHARAWRRWR